MGCVINRTYGLVGVEYLRWVNYMDKGIWHVLIIVFLLLVVLLVGVFGENVGG